MGEKSFGFIIRGKDAEVAADEIKKIINDEFEIETRISREMDHYQKDEAQRGDPVAIAVLILAIPTSILASLQLRDRMKKKDKLDRTLEKIRTQIIKKREVTVKIQYPDGMIKEISSVDSIEILDSINEQRGREQ